MTHAAMSVMSSRPPRPTTVWRSRAGLISTPSSASRHYRNTKGRRVSDLSIGYAIRNSTKTAAGNELTDLELIDSELNHRGLSAGGVRRDRQVRTDLRCSRCRATPSPATAGGSCWW